MTENIQDLGELIQKDYIDNIGDYLANNFAKINGFDYRWNSLITSKPLLFEDIDYLRCNQFINSTITDNEIAAYKSGNLRELYSTFENMLVCNLQYYDRIMSFCTMVFMHYVRINESVLSDYLDIVPYQLEMTPTQIWCCALTNQSSTEWELNYAWQINTNIGIDRNPDKSVLEENFSTLYKNPTFNKFVEYSALRCGTNGFRQTMMQDKISNRKLAQVCSKFTRNSTAISADHLNTVFSFITEQEESNSKLYYALYNCLMELYNNDKTQFSIYVYNSEFVLITTKFSMRVCKDEKGKITKDYIANSYECFIAEESLLKCVKEQIAWAKYKLPFHYDYDKQMMINLLRQLLHENYKNVLCINRMNNEGCLSKITFSGIFSNIYVIEEFMYDHKTIRTYKRGMSKDNAARYIIERGYFIFGNSTDVFNLPQRPNKNDVINHYTSYCIPVIEHMKEAIRVNNLHKNDIIDVVCAGILNPHKLNNKNIKYTNVRGDINSRKLMESMQDKNGDKTDKKTYWQVMTDEK